VEVSEGLAPLQMPRAVVVLLGSTCSRAQAAKMCGTVASLLWYRRVKMCGTVAGLLTGSPIPLLLGCSCSSVQAAYCAVLSPAC